MRPAAASGSMECKCRRSGSKVLRPAWNILIQAIFVRLLQPRGNVLMTPTTWQRRWRQKRACYILRNSEAPRVGAGAMEKFVGDLAGQ